MSGVFVFKNDYVALPCFVLEEAISFKVDKGSPVYCAFLDNEKAFDRIWYNGILYKFTWIILILMLDFGKL